MTYWRELGGNWRALAGATLGFASALSINGFVHSVFGPPLLAEFGWSKAEFALLALIQLLIVPLMPIAGRIADMFGVRAAVLPGVIVYPLSFVAMNMMSGQIGVYYAIYVVQLVFCVTTTATVWCRVVADRFTAARGLALGLMACGPPIVGGVGSPLLTNYIAEHGWRAGCLAFAAFSAIAGCLALLLVPGGRPQAASATGQPAAKRDYAAIFANPAFWIIFISAFLTAIPFALAQAQLNLMLIDRNLAPSVAAYIISVFAFGVFAGRLLLGVSLDRFPTHLVAASGMALSGIGLIILASPTTDATLLMLGVGLVGLAYGAEADIVGYAVVRYFGIHVYSSVLGLMTAGMAAAMTIGGVVLTAILQRTDRYEPFMIFAAVAVFLGSANFLRLRKLNAVAAEPAKDQRLSGLD